MARFSPAITTVAVWILLLSSAPSVNGWSNRPASRRDLLIQTGAGVSAFGISSFFPSLGIPPAQAAPVSEASRQVIIPGGGPATYQPKGIGSSWKPPVVLTQLGQSRLLAKELTPLQQPFLGGQELYYSPFLFGAWNVTATLRRKIYPYGPDYLPSASLLEGSPRYREEQVGDSTNYEVHYFSTLANTVENQARVNLGLGVPGTKIIQDRAYNAKSLSVAYKQLTPVQEVEWNYRDEPGKVLLDFGSGLLAEDMRPLGPRRTEVFLTARVSEDAGDEIHYCTAERSRSVTLVTRDAVVADTETISEFTKVANDHVTAWSRIAVYLTPNPNSREGLLWQQTGGKAVAFFDYELDLRRIKEEFQLKDGTKMERACVLTPKDVVQCS